MKEKIAERLKNKYSNLGLSKEALIGVASFLEKTITNEEDIDTSIEQPYVADYLKSQQTELDRIRGERARLEKEFKEYKEKNPVNQPIETEPTPVADVKNEELENLKKQFAEIQLKLAESDRKILRSQIESKVQEVLKNKGCTNETIRNLVMGKVNISEDATLESVDKIAEDGLNLYNSLYKSLYGDSPIPPISEGQFNGGYKSGMFDGVVNELVSQGKLPNE